MEAQNREDGGRLVREAWIRWAKRQPDPKPSWLVEWQDLPESDKEADRCIWDEIAAPYNTMISELVATSVRLRSDLYNLRQLVKEYHANTAIALSMENETDATQQQIINDIKAIQVRAEHLLGDGEQQEG